MQIKTNICEFWLGPSVPACSACCLCESRANWSQRGTRRSHGQPADEINEGALKNNNSRSLRTVTSLCSKSKCSLEWFDWKWVAKSFPHLHIKLCPCDHNTTVGQPPVLQKIHESGSESGSWIRISPVGDVDLAAVDHPVLPISFGRCPSSLSIDQTIKQQIKYSNHRPACHCQHPALWLQGLPRTPRRPWQAGTGPISCSFWSGPQQTKAWAKFLMIRQISPFALWCHSAGCKALLWWSEGQCWGSSRSFGVSGLVC